MLRKAQTVCFSGQNLKYLPFGVDETNNECISLKIRLYEKIFELISQGYTHFILGMSLGIDTWLAEEILKLKKQYPYLKLEAAIPYEEQAKNWNKHSRERYYHILSECDITTFVSHPYTKDCIRKQSKYMVDCSALIVAVYSYSNGGTGYTMDYAKKNDIKTCMIYLAF